jgi:hypothetical protein
MIGEIGEIVEWFVAAFAGWRYVFSASYRKKKHEDWRNVCALSVVWDMCCGFAGIAFSFLVVYLVVYAVIE